MLIKQLYLTRKSFSLYNFFTTRPDKAKVCHTAYATKQKAAILIVAQRVEKHALVIRPEQFFV